MVPFANAYAASTDNPGGTAAQVTATKALMGRPLSAGEFTFAVKYATGGDDLRTAKNAADGTVTFDALHYTTEMLEGPGEGRQRLQDLRQRAPPRGR